MIFIDTNVAIALRDGEPAVRAAVVQLVEVPVLSIITRIELENGVHRDPAAREWRRRMLESIPIEMLTHADVLAYGDIVGDQGHDRRLTLDRLIAAQAISRNASLITRNGKDFRRIKRLNLIEWETPN